MDMISGQRGSMCIRDVNFITEADAICISMHSQRYDTLKKLMKQL